MNFIQVLFILFNLALCVGEPADRKVIIQGDVYIAGLFQIYDAAEGKCSQPSARYVQIVEAVKWTLRLLNTNNFIPNVTLGLVALPTCGLVSRANNDTFQLIMEMKYRNKNRTYVNNIPQPVVAIIGPPFSSEVQTTSQIISSLPEGEQFPQIGYSATATTLKNRNIYKNFVSVIPSDDIQVQVMIELMKKLEWNYIAVLYEDDKYGREGVASLRRLAKDSRICIYKEFKITVSRNQQVNAGDLKRILDDIFPTIKGVVFFGGITVAHLLLQKHTHFDDKISFIFSESIGLNENVFFEDGTRQIIPRGNRSFVLSPPAITVKDFSSHWNKLFRNSSYRHAELSSNPWLSVVNSSGKVERSIYTGYAIKSVLLLAKVLKDLHDETCNGNAICPGFKDVIVKNKQTIMSKISSSLSRFSYVFPSPINETLFEPIESLHKESLNTGNPPPSYDIYQFGKCLNRFKRQTDPYCLNKVGHYENQNLKLNPNTSIPDIAECKIGEKCPRCLSPNLYDEVYFEEGDVYVVGIVPIFLNVKNDPTGCGDVKKSHSVELAESMAFAVKTCNNDTSCFPGKNVGFVMINSCNQRLVIQRKILELVKDGYPHPNGSYVNIRDKIMGFVGGFSSTVSLAAANVLKDLKFVQVSYAASTNVLTNRQIYPLFLRVSQPNKNEAIAAMDIMKRLQDSSYVQVMYSEGAYGESCNAAFKEEAKRRKICIANEIKVLDGHYSGITQKLRQKIYANVVVIFLQSYAAVGIATELQRDMEKGEFMFIGTQSLGQTPAIIKGNDKLLGSITMSLEMDNIPGLNRYLRDRLMSQNNKNPWLKRYVEERRDCYLKGSYNKENKQKCPETLPEMMTSYQQEQWTPFAYSSMITFLKGASETFHNLCGWKWKLHSLCPDFREKPEKLWENVKKQKLNITGNLIDLYDSNGDGSTGFKVYNVQRDKTDLSNIEYVRIGETYTNDSDICLEMDQLKLPDGIALPSQCPNKVTCTKCFGTGPNDSGTGVSSATIGLIVGVVILIIVVVILVVLIVIKLRVGRNKMTTEDDNYMTVYDASAKTYCEAEYDGTPYDTVMDEPRARNTKMTGVENGCVKTHEEIV